LFDIDFDNQKKELKSAKDYKHTFLLYPKLWKHRDYQFLNELEWFYVKFKKDAHKNVEEMDLKGIYAFMVEPPVKNFMEHRYLLYVGQTTRPFKVRFNEYLREKAGHDKPRFLINQMLNKWKTDMYFFFAPMDDNTEIDDAETKFINAFLPPANYDIPGKINRVYSNLYKG